MFGWFKKKSYEVQVEIEQPVVEDEKPELNISEPIFSFVECVRNNPKRFTVINGEIVQGSRVAKKTLLDKKTGQRFEYAAYYSFEIRYTYPKYLTKDEFEYIKDEVTSIFTARRDRLNELKEIRKQRANKLERQKLMDIYCNKESQM